MLLVVDAMIGQDAVKISKGFHDRLGLTGVVLTKLDGDARGGAALSVKEVTGAPVRFSGIGEALDKFEEFRAEGMASRVLGMGDVVGLMKDFQEVIDEKDAAEKAHADARGRVHPRRLPRADPDDPEDGEPSRTSSRKMPGMGDMLPADVNIDDRELVRVEAIIQSFTRFERQRPLRPHPRALARDADREGVGPARAGGRRSSSRSSSS